MQKLSPRQARRERKKLQRKITIALRRDLKNILKKKPFLLPFSVWVFLLSTFLKVDNIDIKSLCQEVVLMNK